MATLVPIYTIVTCGHGLIFRHCATAELYSKHLRACGIGHEPVSCHAVEADAHFLKTLPKDPGICWAIPLSELGIS